MNSKVITSGSDYTVRIFDASTAAELHKMEGHQGMIYVAPAVSPEGTYAVTISSDTTARVWDLSTGAELQRPMGSGYENSIPGWD